MYKRDDIVVYGCNGVCVVEAVGRVDMKCVDPDKEFYTLRAIYDDVKILAPTDTSVPIRPVLSKVQALALIDKIPDTFVMETDELDPRRIENTYRDLMSTGKCSDLLTLIKFLYSKERTISEAGKKLGQIDQRYLKCAETRVNDEFAIALDMPREQIHDFIMQRLEQLGCTQYNAEPTRDARH